MFLKWITPWNVYQPTPFILILSISTPFYYFSYKLANRKQQNMSLNSFTNIDYLGNPTKLRELREDIFTFLDVVLFLFLKYTAPFPGDKGYKAFYLLSGDKDNQDGFVWGF